MEKNGGSQPVGDATFFLVRIYENTARSPIEQYLSQKKIC